MSLLALERTALRWTRRLALVGGGLLLGVALVTVVDALLRSFLGRPLQGTFEATELVLAAIIFFGMPFTSLTDGHVAADFLTARLAPRAQHAIMAANAFVVTALLALITAQMAFLAAEYHAIARTTITTRIPIVPFIVPVTLASALATLCFLLHGMGALARAMRPGLPPLPTASS